MWTEPGAVQLSERGKTSGLFFDEKSPVLFGD